MDVRLEMLLGQSIQSACAEAVIRARADNCQVGFDFNGQMIVVTPETDPEQAAQAYMDECDRKHQEYLASQEYRDRQEELAKKERERKAKVDAFLVDGPEAMTLTDADGWEQAKAANTDPYGGAVMTYAERWARIMEARMNHGERLEDIADECSHLANEEGITGFMFGAAVSTLAHVWKYGRELMVWHTGERGA